jgi:hypothetical protein
VHESVLVEISQAAVNLPLVIPCVGPLNAWGVNRQSIANRQAVIRFKDRPHLFCEIFIDILTNIPAKMLASPPQKLKAYDWYDALPCLYPLITRIRSSLTFEILDMI